MKLPALALLALAPALSAQVPQDAAPTFPITPAVWQVKDRFAIPKKN